MINKGLAYNVQKLIEGDVNITVYLKGSDDTVKYNKVDNKVIAVWAEQGEEDQIEFKIDSFMDMATLYNDIQSNINLSADKSDYEIRFN